MSQTPRSWIIPRTAAFLTIALIIPLTAPHGASGQDADSWAGEEVTPGDNTAPGRFRFHSGFWLNLHNFLFMEARRDAGIDDLSLGGRGDLAFDTAAVRSPTTAERELWRGTIAIFRRDKVEAAIPDSATIRVENRLARIPDESTDLSAVVLPESIRGAMLEFAPVYRELWWPAHDRRNRQWIWEREEDLAEHGDELVADLEAALGSELPREIRVDATVYANWFGAYTSFEPPHITISTSAIGSSESWGLEILLHEASHLGQDRIEGLIQEAADQQGRSTPRQLGHLILFYTTGEIVKSAIPEHSSYAEEFGIWSQNGPARRYRNLLRAEWQPYLDGDRTLEVAIDRLVRRAP